jgi:hypothetical protein
VFFAKDAENFTDSEVVAHIYGEDKNEVYKSFGDGLACGKLCP